MDLDSFRILVTPEEQALIGQLMGPVRRLGFVDDMLVLVPAALFAARAVASSCAPAIRGVLGEWRVRRLLRRLGIEAAHGLLLPHPDRAGWTEVDHLARLPDRILVLETKSLRGRLSAHEGERTWTRQLGRRAFQIPSPLWQNALHVAAVRALVGPGVRVDGMVVLVGSGWFPDRLPNGCYRLEGCRRRLGELGAAVDCGALRRRRLDHGWHAVLAAGSRRWRDRRRHITDIEQAHGRERRLTRGVVRAIGYAVTAGALLGLYLAA